MKCLSCEMEINPKWKHAIDSNICPFCGESILNDHLRDGLALIRSTMDALQEHVEQLDDWMFSNYAYVKVDSERFKSLYRPISTNLLPEDRKRSVVKVTTEKGEEDVVVEKIQSEEKTNEFYKRAEAVKPNIDGYKNVEEKTKHLKEMVKQIKKNGIGSGSITDSSDIADPSEVAEMQAMMSDEGIISSALPEANDWEDEIPSVVRNMAAHAKNNGATSDADVAKLQQMHHRTQESRRNFATGAKGSFSRA